MDEEKQSGGGSDVNNDEVTRKNSTGNTYRGKGSIAALAHEAEMWSIYLFSSKLANQTHIVMEKEVGIMTKSEMVKKLAESWGGISNRQANDNLDALIELIGKTVKKEKVLKIPNLGSFKLRQTKARTGRNPQTGEPMKIPARRKVAFTPAKTFKESILGPAKK